MRRSNLFPVNRGTSPQPEFVEGQHVRVRYRSITLGIPSDPSDLVLLEQELLDALYWGASRFLTPHQVKQRLHDLWTQRPELLQMYLEEGVGLTMVLGVLRYLLDRQYSIWDFALIVEEAIFQCRVRSDESVAERVESNLAELLKENRFGPLPPETDERPKGSFDVVCVEMSRDSLFILDPQCSDAFFERMKSLRTRIAQKFGWVVPGVRLRDNFMLPKAEFRICIRGKVVLTGKLRPGLIMAMGSEEMLRQLSGVSCVEPLRGLPCVWISQDSQEHAASLGCLCFTAESVVATALAYLIEENADQLFTLHNVQEALDDLRDSNRPLAEIVEKESELLLLIKDVCCELLAERVPLVDIELIFETVVRERRAELSPFYLAEKVRLRIAHLIYRHHLDANGRLSAFTLAAELEQWCLERLVEGREDTRLELDKVSASLLRDALKELLQSQSESGRDPVLVACPVLRKPLRRFTRQFAPRLTILSEEEVPFDLLDHLGAGGTVAAQWPSRTAKHRPSPGGERRFRRPKKIRKSR